MTQSPCQSEASVEQPVSIIDVFEPVLAANLATVVRRKSTCYSTRHTDGSSAAVGTAPMRTKMIAAVALAKIYGPAPVDTAFATAAVLNLARCT